MNVRQGSEATISSTYYIRKKGTWPPYGAVTFPQTYLILFEKLDPHPEALFVFILFFSGTIKRTKQMYAE